MRGDDRADQIEVELTSSGNEQARFSRQADLQQVSEPTGPRHDRSRTIAVTALVGVLALTLGWMLGRSSADGERQVRSVTTAALGRTNLVEPIDPVQPEGTERVATTPSAPPRSSATTAPLGAPNGGPIADVGVEISPSIAGQPIEIVAVGNGRRLLRLDLATGRFADQQATGQPFGRARVILGDGWVLFPSGGANLPSTLVEQDGSVAEIDLGAGRNLIGTASVGLWRITSDVLGDDRLTVEPITITGEPAGAEVDLPGLPSGFDPAGGFVIEAAGGVYAVAESATTRITTGTLLALSAEVALADECDEELVCGVVAIDRSTGERRPLDLRLPVGPTRLRSFESVSENSVSFDGEAAIVRVLNPIDRASSQPTLGIIDLATSEVIEVGPAQNIEEAVWTPDGRFVLYISGGRLVAFDRLERTESIVAPELIAIETFATRLVGDS